MATPTLTAQTCEVCERPASTAGMLTAWYGVVLCLPCVAVAEGRAATDACVCFDCLRHQHDQEVQP